MTQKFYHGFIYIIIIFYIIIILAKRSDTQAWNNIYENPSSKAIVLFPLFLLPKIGFTFFQNFLLPLMSDI